MWTKTPPTEPGVYWHRRDPLEVPDRAHVYGLCDRLLVDSPRCLAPGWPLERFHREGSEWKSTDGEPPEYPESPKHWRYDWPGGVEPLPDDWFTTPPPPWAAWPPNTNTPDQAGA
jgi:hypothetical protein